MITLVLPYPSVTGNHAWKHTRTGGHYLTRQASDYYQLVRVAVLQQARVVNMAEPLAVSCTLFPPDRRRRDMDNAWKVIGDSLTRAGLWQDDHLIRRLTIQWGEPVKGGKALVSVGLSDEISLSC